jgi:hypothetical protein
VLFEGWTIRGKGDSVTDYATSTCTSHRRSNSSNHQMYMLFGGGPAMLIQQKISDLDASSMTGALSSTNYSRVRPKTEVGKTRHTCTSSSLPENFSDFYSFKQDTTSANRSSMGKGLFGKALRHRRACFSCSMAAAILQQIGGIGRKAVQIAKVGLQHAHT